MQLSNVYKAPKGLIKIRAEVENNLIIDIIITGDFFMVPENSLKLLENSLRGVELSTEFVNEALEKFYAIGVETPMVGKEDFAKAILGVKSEAQVDK